MEDFGKPAPMDPRSDKDLILSARRGDRDAFDILVLRQRPRFEALVRSRLGRELGEYVPMEDVTQESFLRALRSIETLRGEDAEAFLRWLGGIANHVILETARRHKRELILALGDDVGDDESASPSRAGRRDERFERLQAALDSLTEDHRRVIWLARIQRLPIQEIAERLDRSPAASSRPSSRR